MNGTESMHTLAGYWTGSNQLWMMPGEPAHESETTLTVKQAVRGGFMALHYTWAEGGEAQEGILVIGPLTDAKVIQAEWIDTFHTAGGFMPFTGTVADEGTITLQGSYSVGDSPPWGWQIRIPPPAGNRFQLLMFNISPEGEEYPAVEATYTRG